MLTGISFAVLTIFIHSKIFISPKEKQLLRELEETEMQIDIINKRVDLLSNVLQGMEYKDDNLYRVLLEAEPIQNRNITIENLLLDNSHSKNYSKTLKELSRKVDILTARSQVQLESYKQLWELSEKRRYLCFNTGYLTGQKSKIVSGFGMRYHPIYKILRRHTGVDIIGRRGTPIYATADGVVSRDNAGRAMGLMLL